MAELHSIDRLGYRLARSAPAAGRALFGAMFAACRRSPERALQGFRNDVSEPDQAAIDALPDEAKAMGWFIEAGRKGGRGPTHDYRALGDWAFPLGDVTAPSCPAPRCGAARTRATWSWRRTRPSCWPRPPGNVTDSTQAAPLTRQTRGRRGASMRPMLSTVKNIAVVAAATFAVAAPAAGAAAPQQSDSVPPSSSQQQRGYGGYGYHCHRVYRYGHVYRICRYGY